MTIRRQTACGIVAALALLPVPRPALSQSPQLAPLETGFKSVGRAFLLSFLSTAIPTGVALATIDGHSDDPTPALLFFGALVLGPSIGHWYADRPGRALAGVGVRTLAVLGMGAGFAMSWNNDGGEGLFWGGLAVGAASVLWDVLGAPHSARVHNAKRRAQRVTFGLGPSPGALRLGVRLSF